MAPTPLNGLVEGGRTFSGEEVHRMVARGLSWRWNEWFKRSPSILVLTAASCVALAFIIVLFKYFGQRARNSGLEARAQSSGFFGR
jgi:hypothetical protein